MQIYSQEEFVNDSGDVVVVLTNVMDEKDVRYIMRAYTTVNGFPFPITDNIPAGTLLEAFDKYEFVRLAAEKVARERMSETGVAQ